MPNPQLTSYITAERAKGVPDAQIRQALLSSGWQAPDVDAALGGFVNVPAKSKKGGWLKWVILVLVILSVAGFAYAGYQYYSKPIPKIVENTETTVPEDKPEQKTNSVSDSCGLQDQDCFAKKFTLCEPAKVESTLTEGMTYLYEIIGKEGEYCKTVSQFTANVMNPAFENKIMTCLYDNKQPFEDTVTDMSRCSGPLFDLMTSGGSQSEPVKESAKTCDIKDRECFSKKFALCESGSKLKENPFSGITYEHEIISKEGAYCKVVFTVTNPTSQSRAMTCLYDNKKPFEDAITSMERCSGPLYDVMNPK